MKFEDALKKHLALIKNRNLSGFVETIVRDDRPVLILPHGTMITGFEAVAKFHRDWFNDPDWHIETSLVRSSLGKTSRPPCYWLTRVTFLRGNGKIVRVY